MGLDNGWGSDGLGWLLAFTLIPFVVFVVAPILPPAAVGLFVGWRLPRINIGEGLTAGIRVGLAAAMAWGVLLVHFRFLEVAVRSPISFLILAMTGAAITGLACLVLNARLASCPGPGLSNDPG